MIYFSDFGAGVPDPSLAEHWRLRFSDGSTTDDYVGCYELQLRDTVGGADLAASGGGSASSTDGSFVAGNAFDGNTGTAWFSALNNTIDAWLANDIGAATDLAEFLYRGHSSNTNFDPTAIVVEYSLDGSTWYVDSRWPTLSGLPWENGEYKIIPRTDQGTPSWRGTPNASGITSNAGGWVNFTIRMVVNAATLVGTGDRFRFAIRASTTEGFTLNKAYVGIKGAGSYDFASTPVQATFGGNNSITVGSSALILSDPVTLTIGASDDIVVSVFCPTGSSAADGLQRFASATGYTCGFKSGDDATTLTPTGYTAYNFVLLHGLEVGVA